MGLLGEDELKFWRDLKRPKPMPGCVTGQGSVVYTVHADEGH